MKIRKILMASAVVALGVSRLCADTKTSRAAAGRGSAAPVRTARAWTSPGQQVAVGAGMARQVGTMGLRQHETVAPGNLILVSHASAEVAAMVQHAGVAARAQAGSVENAGVSFETNSGVQGAPFDNSVRRKSGAVADPAAAVVSPDANSQMTMRQAARTGLAPARSRRAGVLSRLGIPAAAILLSPLAAAAQEVAQAADPTVWLSEEKGIALIFFGFGVAACSFVNLVMSADKENSLASNRSFRVTRGLSAVLLLISVGVLFAAYNALLSGATLILLTVGGAAAFAGFVVSAIEAVLGKTSKVGRILGGVFYGITAIATAPFLFAAQGGGFLTFVAVVVAGALLSSAAFLAYQD